MINFPFSQRVYENSGQKEEIPNPPSDRKKNSLLSTHESLSLFEKNDNFPIVEWE
jgi:hypothetical protein